MCACGGGKGARGIRGATRAMGLASRSQTSITPQIQSPRFARAVTGASVRINQPSPATASSRQEIERKRQESIMRKLHGK